MRDIRLPDGTWVTTPVYAGCEVPPRPQCPDGTCAWRYSRPPISLPISGALAEVQACAKCHWSRILYVGNPHPGENVESADTLEPDNAQRAWWAEQALAAFLDATGEPRNSIEESITDLITDLLHLAERENISRRGVLRTARRDYFFERIRHCDNCGKAGSAESFAVGLGVSYPAALCCPICQGSTFDGRSY